jgi:hypothetical protein
LLGFAGVILWKIIRNDIVLEGLISEPPDPDNPDLPSKASLSRFQFLLFSFVIAALPAAVHRGGNVPRDPDQRAGPDRNQRRQLHPVQRHRHGEGDRQADRRRSVPESR